MNPARSPCRNWSRVIKPRQLGGFEICSPVRSSVFGNPNVPEKFCRPRPAVGAHAHLGAFHQVPTIFHGLMTSVGKTTTTSNTRRVGFTISIEARINSTGPTDCWPSDQPALQPQLRQCSQSRTSLRFRQTTMHDARGVLYSVGSLARKNSKNLQDPPRQHTEPI